MLKELLRKWFGISEPACHTCEVLREQLHRSEAERKELLNRLLDKDKPEPLSQQVEEPQPIQPAFVPWRVRQQMYEAEDRKKAQVLRERAKEIEDLEKELGVKHGGDSAVG